MKRIWTIVGGLVLFTSVSAYALEFSITPNIWEPNLDAKVKISRLGIGEAVDFQHDLGLNDEGVLGGAVDMKFGRSNHLQFSYWSVGYDSKNHVLKRNIEYNGRTYTANSQVSSSFDLDAFELEYAYDVLNFESFRFGFLANVNLYAVDTELNSPLFTTPNGDNLHVVLPLVGTRFGFGLLENRVQFTGQIAGLWWQGSGFWDGAVGLTLFPKGRFSVNAGYRVIHLDISDNNDSADLKLEGPTFSATLRF